MSLLDYITVVNDDIDTKMNMIHIHNKDKFHVIGCTLPLSCDVSIPSSHCEEPNIDSTDHRTFSIRQQSDDCYDNE